MTKKEQNQEIVDDNISLTSAMLSNIRDSLGVHITALEREREKVAEMLECLETKANGTADTQDKMTQGEAQ